MKTNPMGRLKKTESRQNGRGGEKARGKKKIGTQTWSRVGGKEGQGKNTTVV